MFDFDEPDQPVLRPVTWPARKKIRLTCSQAKQHQNQFVKIVNRFVILKHTMVLMMKFPIVTLGNVSTNLAKSMLNPFEWKYSTGLYVMKESNAKFFPNEGRICLEHMTPIKYALHHQYLLSTIVS